MKYLKRAAVTKVTDGVRMVAAEANVAGVRARPATNRIFGMAALKFIPIRYG